LHDPIHPVAEEAVISTEVVPAAARARSLAWSELATLAGFCAFLFFYGLGSFGLVGADEPRYAQVAREMLARHDWITPVLNGAPWLEKPALYYWCAAVSHKVFGVSDWAARLPSALFATAMIAVIYAFVRRFRPGVQLDAALMAASSAAAIGFARGASTDMPLAATFTIGMLAWYAWWDGGRKRWLAAFYAMMALGMLAKGPVAPALAGMMIAIFAFVWPGSKTRATRWRLIRETLWLPGVLLFLAIALPWYVAVQIKTPQFFRVFVLEHNLERFGTNLYRHKQPFWYYAPVFLLSTLPWTVYLITAIVSRESRVASPERQTDGEAGGFRRFLLLWIAVPLGFFTISQSKLPGYILPAIPPCALLLADWLRIRLALAPTSKPGSSGARPANFALATLHSALCGLLLGGALLSPYFITRLHPPAQATLTAAVAAAVIAVAMLLSLHWQGMRALRFVTLVPVVLALAFVLRVSAPAIDQTQSARPIARELSRLGARGAPLAAFNITRETEYGLDFYGNQPVLRYERGEAPAGDHLLIARAGSEPQLEPFLAGRRLSHVGGFAPQKLEFYWVSMGTAHHH
jgi:4-amino-4-deoxy-L-arabinose transferase-like glycosyltransferase